MIGQLVGNYKIEAKLGEGGMGAVYKGVDTMLDREVAIKALRPELASQTSIVERFRSEAITLAKLNHPNIATLYTMFRQGQELYMVLEFVRGATLDSIMRERGAISAEEAIPVFCQVLDGIDHAHELGIVHRDIKPANMMFTEKGVLKVLDFGIARLLGSARMTRAGNIIGTLEYMAPEQVKGLETDGRSDIYALGMMLYEVLTGQLPFQSDNEFELMRAQTEQLPRRPSEINPAIPKAVEDAIMKAVQKDPNDRFQTGGEFRESLLAAGFSANGSFAGVTGAFQAKPTHPSHPPQISKDSPPTTEDVAKGTRVAPFPFVPPTSDEMDAFSSGGRSTGGVGETRVAGHSSSPGPTVLAPAAAVPIAAPMAPAASQGSFFSRLTALHYIGGAIVILVLFGFLIAGAGALVFVTSSSDEPAAANKAVANTNANQKAANSVTVKETPQETSPRQSAPPPSYNAPAPVPMSNNPPVSEPPPPSDTKPPKSTTPKKQAPPPQPKKKKPTAEELLTGR